MRQELTEVLKEAHKGHQYVSDTKQYKELDKWRACLKGDCEDFALWCKNKLRDCHDIESNLVMCKTEYGEYHLVLNVEGWILDNRKDDVYNRDESDYEWLSQCVNGKWYKILN